MWLSMFIHSLLNLILPARCFGCGSGGDYLCTACLQAAPTAEIDDTGVEALFDYRHPPIQRAIWALKYRHASSIADIFAGALGARLLDEVADERWVRPGRGTPVIITGVPLWPARERWRGFNQAAALAKSVAKKSPFPLEFRSDILIKIKNTPPQVSLNSRATRQKNVRGAFAAGRPAAVAGRDIIVLDDVTTTGATLTEAGRALGAVGVGSVFTIAVARG
ncbi:MAG: phosphoribosyltransferase family protein [Patescibacteria group bacterium]